MAEIFEAGDIAPPLSAVSATRDAPRADRAGG
jgi:hypothetical protein